MCGYCVESGYFQGLIDHSDDPVSARMLQRIHLQESPSWFEYYQSHKDDMTQLDDMIALCRGWDEHFFRPDRKNALSLKSLMTPDRWNALGQRLRPYAPSPRWEWILQVDWIGIEPDIEEAARVLSVYRRICLPWSGDKKSRRRMAGAYPSLGSERLFWVYIALMLLDRFDPKFSDAIYVARELPERVPAFDGLELWLQRRAVKARVRRDGVGFINAHREAMRSEIVSSLAMGVRADANYSIGLEKAIRQNDKWGECIIGADRPDRSNESEESE